MVTPTAVTECTPTIVRAELSRKAAREAREESRLAWQTHELRAGVCPMLDVTFNEEEVLRQYHDYPDEGTVCALIMRDTL